MKTESYRKFGREAEKQFLIFIILQMRACANILHMDTAVFSAVVSERMMQH